MNARHAPLSIASDHPALAGHFPGTPIVPGVVLLDAALQLMGRGAQAPLYLAVVKFHRVVRPGEQLTLQWQQQPDAAVAFDIRQGEHIVVSGSVASGPAPTAGGS